MNSKRKILILILALTLIVPIACTKKAADEAELKIDYEKYTLANGLEVVLHEDLSDPIVSVAVQYHVGSNREEPGRTGFAHLFEHMMFRNPSMWDRTSFSERSNLSGEP